MMPHLDFILTDLTGIQSPQLVDDSPVTGKKIVLWDYQGSQRGIPEHQTYYRMNFWHTNEWGVETNANAIEKPLHPFELEVNWMSYDAFNE